MYHVKLSKWIKVDLRSFRVTSSVIPLPPWIVLKVLRNKGLLAFHQALVSNPQDAFVIWVFVSVLYNGKWEEVVKIARERAKDQVNFAPEISGFLKLNQMKNLSELASLVQDCVNALNETHSGMVNDSGMVYVSMKWDGCWSNFLMHW
ncbi:uncharacterized protein LOC116134460 isoform X3 [Pistacia vera]|uniref:uncharacterized protein LOC116134460 isoform X3 n=1 Tax=Pistacia vera TaxID=55513 RepID=UPI00126394E5|nr:uncharacterized protein LOC116134460 isoform X3 [Pistacia vera]